MGLYDLRFCPNVVKVDENLSVVSAVYYASADEERTFRSNA
jgi:hypothetical protein